MAMVCIDGCGRFSVQAKSITLDQVLQAKIRVFAIHLKQAPDVMQLEIQGNESRKQATNNLKGLPVLGFAHSYRSAPS